MGIQEFSLFFKNRAQILTILVFKSLFTIEFTTLQLYISGNQISKKIYSKSIFKGKLKSAPVVSLRIAILRPEVPFMNS